MSTFSLSAQIWHASFLLLCFRFVAFYSLLISLSTLLVLLRWFNAHWSYVLAHCSLLTYADHQKNVFISSFPLVCFPNLILFRHLPSTVSLIYTFSVSFWKLLRFLFHITLIYCVIYCAVFIALLRIISFLILRLARCHTSLFNFQRLFSGVFFIVLGFLLVCFVNVYVLLFTLPYMTFPSICKVFNR